MARHFDPEVFDNRVIVVDMTTHPAAEFMNCIGCGRLVSELYKYDELCGSCYARWRKAFSEGWVRLRFG